MEKSNSPKRDVYEFITDRIIAQLEKGNVPWKIPWTQVGIPKNLVSGKPYNGINVWLLASLGHTQNLFLSFKQIVSLGGTVKKGEKACPVVFWNWKEKKDESSGEIRKIPYLRYYMVFNVEQCDNIPVDKIPVKETRENDPIANCEQIIEGMPNSPKFKFGQSEASYNPVKDVINIPTIGEFINSDSYYATLFHEMVHSTGHKNRLNRKGITEPIVFGTKLYSLEELIAELGASFLNSIAGIGEIPFENQVAYIQNWLSVLKNDKRFIVIASGKAQHAVDYILGKVAENTVKVEKEEIKEESVSS